MTSVSVNTYTHSVTYVADNILKSLKDIIRLSGLNPTNFVSSWETNLRAVRTWIESGDLEKIILEIFDPQTDNLIYGWEIEIDYRYSTDEGCFYADSDQLKYNIRKAGISLSRAEYSLLMKTKPGRPDVKGWGKGQQRSTVGMTKQSLGSTISHNGLGAKTSYWRH